MPTFPPQSLTSHMERDGHERISRESFAPPGGGDLTVVRRRADGISGESYGSGSFPDEQRFLVESSSRANHHQIEGISRESAHEAHFQETRVGKRRRRRPGGRISQDSGADQFLHEESEREILDDDRISRESFAGEGDEGKWAPVEGSISRESESGSFGGDHGSSQRISRGENLGGIRYQKKGQYPEESGSPCVDVKISGFRRIKRICKNARSPLNLSINICSDAFMISIKYPAGGSLANYNNEGLRGHGQNHHRQHHPEEDGNDQWKMQVVTPTGKDYEIPKPLVCPPAPCKRKRE